MSNSKKSDKKTEIIMNEKSMEILVAKFIPTSQYFERSFEMLNGKLEDFKEEQREFNRSILNRFEQVDKRFEQIDKRFEQFDDKLNEFKKDVDKRFEQFDDKLNEFKKDVDKRFEQVDKRFEQVDKRFEQIDKRFEQIDKKFEQVDKRFEQVDKRFETINNNISNLTLKIEQLTKAQEVTIRDYIIERDRHYDTKFSNLRMFNIATISLVAGVILKMMGIISFN